MAKFSGMIGFADAVRKPGGIVIDEVIEREVFGDMLNSTTRWQVSDKVNDDLNISNRISILADSYTSQNFQKIKYIKINDVAWKVTSLEVQYPRLILAIGGVYNGEQANTAGET